MIVPIVRSQISRLVCLSMFSPVSGPTGLRGHRRSPPLGGPKLLQRPGQLTRGGCLRQSNRSVWSGFRPDVCEGAWQHSSKRVTNHSIRYGQNSSTKLGRQARAKTRPDQPARPARLRLAPLAPRFSVHPSQARRYGRPQLAMSNFRSNHGSPPDSGICPDFLLRRCPLTHGRWPRHWHQ